MSEIEWGPKIAVNGKRPEWPGEDDNYIPVSTSGSEYEEARPNGMLRWGVMSWENTGSIRLPADHPYYGCAEATEFNSLDYIKTPEDLRDYVEGHVQEMTTADLIAELQKRDDKPEWVPEPVDPAKELAAKFYGEWAESSETLPAFLERAIRAGMELKA